MTNEQQPPDQDRGVGELPALPKEYLRHGWGYSADQMEDYARAAIAALTQPKVETSDSDVSDLIEWLGNMASHPAWNGFCNDSHMPAMFKKAAAIVTALSLPRQSEAEPVAWRITYDDGGSIIESDKGTAGYASSCEYKVEPLYTTPQPAQATCNCGALTTGDDDQRRHSADCTVYTTPAAHGVVDGMVELAMKVSDEYWNSPDQVASCDECNGTGKVPCGDHQDWCGTCSGGVINTGTEEGAMRAALTAVLQAASAPGGR